MRAQGHPHRIQSFQLQVHYYRKRGSVLICLLALGLLLCGAKICRWDDLRKHESRGFVKNWFGNPVNRSKARLVFLSSYGIEIFNVSIDVQRELSGFDLIPFVRPDEDVHMPQGVRWGNNDVATREGNHPVGVAIIGVREQFSGPPANRFWHVNQLSSDDNVPNAGGRPSVISDWDFNPNHSTVRRRLGDVFY